MSDTPLPVRIAQTLGITSSALIAGSVLTISVSLVPRILESPSPLLLRQWSRTYNNGKKTVPPIAALSSACYFYLAYTLPASEERLKLYSYVLAGALAVGIIPYTGLFMLKTNRKLLAKAQGTSTLGKNGEVVDVGPGEETAHKLVDLWSLMNLGRAAMLTAASVIGAWTALNFGGPAGYGRALGGHELERGLGMALRIG